MVFLTHQEECYPVKVDDRVRVPMTPKNASIAQLARAIPWYGIGQRFDSV